MRATCPECGAHAPISAMFAEDEGKRLAMIAAGMVPELGRAVLSYLGLFKPRGGALRLARAAKIAQEIAELAAAGVVVVGDGSRAATASQWAAGIEKLLAARTRLVLPLEDHSHLESVVYELAGKAVNVPTARREGDARDMVPYTAAKTGITPSPHAETPLERQMGWIAHMVTMEQFTPEQAEEERRLAREKFGSA